MLSPMMMGIMGVLLPPVSYPSSWNPWRILSAMAIARLGRSGSVRTISSAAKQAATLAAGMEALKMSDRAWCWM